MHIKLEKDLVGKKRGENVSFIIIFWIDLLSTPVPDGTVEPKAITNARQLFKSCISVYTYETGDVYDVLDLIDREFGGYPEWKNSVWGKKKFDLAEVLLKLNQYNFRPIFDVRTKSYVNYLNIKNYNQRVNFDTSKIC